MFVDCSSSTDIIQALTNREGMNPQGRSKQFKSGTAILYGGNSHTHSCIFTSSSYCTAYGRTCPMGLAALGSPHTELQTCTSPALAI